jgi:hypothetical protein
MRISVGWIHKVGFPIRLRDVHALVVGDNSEDLLDLREPFLRHGDGSIVQFMLQDNMTMLIVGAVFACCDPFFKVAIDGFWREIATARACIEYVSLSSLGSL